MDRNTELALIERAQAKLAQRERELAPRDVELSTQRYTDPAWFDGEMTAIFQQAPSIVAHASELPEPGSFLTQQHFGRPLLVTRDSQGEARIFLNVCRHRGAQLETSAKGCKQRFVCGYHAWSYDDKGKLANVPSGFCFPSIETRRRDLVQLAVVEAYGFIWLMPQREAGIAALDAFLGPVREDLAALDLGEFEVYGAQTESWRFNWKLFVEGTLEGYHFPILHPKSAQTMFADQGFFFDEMGLHLRSVLPKRSIGLLSRKPVEQWSLPQVANIIYTVFPHETILHQSDHFLWMTPHPISANETLVKLRLLIPRNQRGGAREADWQANRELTYRIQQEDLEIYQSIHQGLASGANEAHLLGRHEHALAQFHANLERFRQTGHADR